MNLTLYNPQQAHALMTEKLWPWAKSMLAAGHRLTLTIKPETRSMAQNRRMWAMLGEISQKVDWYGRKLTPEEWKIVFSASLKKQDVVPGLDGGFVVMGIATSKMTRAEMSELQTLMEAFGAEKGVIFPEPPGWVNPETGEISE